MAKIYGKKKSEKNKNRMEKKGKKSKEKKKKQGKTGKAKMYSTACIPRSATSIIFFIIFNTNNANDIDIIIDIAISNNDILTANNSINNNNLEKNDNYNNNKISIIIRARTIMIVIPIIIKIH